jgi:hypothetical protein
MARFDIIHNLGVAAQKEALEKQKKYDKAWQDILNLDMIKDQKDQLDKAVEQFYNLNEESFIEMLDQLDEDSTKIEIKPTDILAISILSALASGSLITEESLNEYKNSLTLKNLLEFFELYLYWCLEYILEKHPKMLGSREIILKDLMDKTKKQIINEEISRYLHNLFYKSYNEIFSEIKKFFKLEHGISDNKIRRIQFYKEVRNIYTHNHGILNQRFLTKTKRLSKIQFKLGDKFVLKDEFITKFQKLTMEIIDDIDITFTGKFPETIVPFKEQAIRIYKLIPGLKEMFKD